MDGGATLGGLKAAIQEKLGVPLGDQLLSKNPALVRALRGPAHAPAWPAGLPCCAAAGGLGARCMVAEQRTRCQHAAAHHAALLARRNPRDLPARLAPAAASHPPRPQLTAKDAGPATFGDLQDDGAALGALGVAHGDVVFLLYHFEREVGGRRACAGCSCCCCCGGGGGGGGGSGGG